jgi:ABC-2 type transport system ATP-binding protein
LPFKEDNNPMLEVKNLTKKFNNIPVVNEVNFIVKPGDILGYLGPNGAGKSTTVKMITGLLQPTRGEIYYNGEKIDGDNIDFKRKIGYVPEQSYLYSHLSAFEYLQLVGRLHDIPEHTLEEKISALLEEFKLSDTMHISLSSFSKGMIQKVMITAALMHNPDILILDEPLTGLDVSATFVFKGLLSRMAQAGKIVIYSSHILDVVEKICNRVIIINEGKIVADDSVKGLIKLMKLSSLESVFKELVQQDDSISAENIFSIMQSG